MADIGTLPEPGVKPWNLNPAITAMNAELESTTAVVTEGRLSEATLSATIGSFNRPSIMLRDRLTPGATAAQNRTAYQAAVVSAETFGASLCYDGAFFTITGEPVRCVAARPHHWATDVNTHKVTHTTRGKGPIRTSGARGLFENLNLDGANPTLAGFTGQNVAQSAGIFIEPGADDTAVRGGRVAGFKVGVFPTIAPYDLLADQEMQAASIPNITTDFVTYPDLTNITVDGLHSDGCWAAFVPQAIKGWEAANITGWYQKMPQSGSEAHLVYPTAVGTRYGTDFTLHDCHATGGDERHAFRPRGQRNGRVWNLRATGCPGLIQFLECEDVEMGEGCWSYDDKLNGNDGSGSISWDNCKRAHQAPASVTFRAGHVAPPGGSIATCEDIIVNGMTVVDNSPTTNPVSTTAMYRISGANVRVELNSPNLRATGVGAVPIGIFCSTAGDDATVREPVVRGNVTVGIRVSAAGPKIIYRPGDVEGNTRKIQLEAAGITLVNLNSGMRPDRDPSLLAYHSGEGVSASSSSTGTSWTNGQVRAFAAGTWGGDPTLGRLTTTAGGLSMTTVATTANADVSCQARRGTTTRAGIALRTVSASDTLALVLTAAGVELVKYEAGTTTVLASAAVAFPGAAFADLRALAVGTTIVGLLNGVQVLTHTLAGGDDTKYVSVNHGLFVNTSSNPLAQFQRVGVRAVS